MNKTANPPRDTPNKPEPDEFWTRDTVLRFFGGDRPLHTSTLYRGIGTVYPRPVNVAPGSVRWLASECRQAAAGMIAARNKRKPKSTGRGRKRKRIA